MKSRYKRKKTYPIVWQTPNACTKDLRCKMPFRVYFFPVSVIVIVVLAVAIATKQICPNKIIAERYPIKGIDISHHQGTIEWKQLQDSEIDFVFIKATEGSGYVDEKFSMNWAGAEENGILCGAYHFFSFDSAGSSQAESYINTVGSLSGKLPPVVDVEFYADKEINRPLQNDVQQELKDFLQTIEREYSVKPIIYTTYKVYKLYLNGSFEEYPLWIRNVYYPPYDKKWQFWQYSDQGKLTGVGDKNGCVDLNVFQGDAGELQMLILP